MSVETLNLLRAAATVLAMLAFFGAALWAWNHRRRETYDAAARLPLEEDVETPATTTRRNGTDTPGHQAS